MKNHNTVRLLPDQQRRYLEARETAVDAVERICRAKAPIPRPGTQYHTCPTCGGLLTERYDFCRWCGQKLLNEEEEEA